MASDAALNPNWFKTNVEPYVNEANARLIAAAPDLLEACIALVNVCDENWDDLAHEDKIEVSTARDAIAKAEGGE